MTKLTENTKAPSFTGKDQDGKTVKSADFIGKKIVLYFYPEDGTPTCTVQACNLRDNFALLKKNGFVVIGVSPDENAIITMESFQPSDRPFRRDPTVSITHFGHQRAGQVERQSFIDSHRAAAGPAPAMRSCKGLV